LFQDVLVVNNINEVAMIIAILEMEPWSTVKVDLIGPVGIADELNAVKNQTENVRRNRSKESKKG